MSTDPEQIRTQIAALLADLPDIESGGLEDSEIDAVAARLEGCVALVPGREVQARQQREARHHGVGHGRVEHQAHHRAARKLQHGHVGLAAAGRQLQRLGVGADQGQQQRVRNGRRRQATHWGSISLVQLAQRAGIFPPARL